MNAEQGAATRRGPGRFLVLVGAVIVQLILGTVYGYSIFWQPIADQVLPKIVTSAQLEAAPELASARPTPIIVADEAARSAAQVRQQGLLKYAFSICILSFAIVMVIAGRIQDVTGPRIPALAGATLMGLGFAIAGCVRLRFAYFAAHASVTAAFAIALLALARFLMPRRISPRTRLAVQVIILAACAGAGILLARGPVGRQGQTDQLLLLWGAIGLLAGAGIGFAYVCPIAALVKWFPAHKGLVSGLAVAGFGFGAFIFKGAGLGALGYIEHHDITQFFFVHALVCFIGISIGAMLLRNPPDYHRAAAEAPAESTWRDTLQRPAFYVLWLMFFSGALAGLMVIGIVKVFAGEQLVAAAGGTQLAEPQVKALLLRGAAAVGWLALFNAVGRVVWGFVSDLVGRTPAFVAMFLLQAATMFLLIGMRTELSLAVAASLVGFNFGGNFALFPSATADYFGSKHLGANYGWVFTSYGVAGVVGIAAGNTAKALTGSYGAAFALAGALCLASAGLAVGLGLSQGRGTAAGRRTHGRLVPATR